MSVNVIVASPILLEEMKTNYQSTFVSPFPQHSVFSAKKNGTTITAYKSGKVVFQGSAADTESKIWIDKGAKADEKKSNTAASVVPLPNGFNTWSVMGSDEVGTGSYFGPLTVAATYVDSSQIDLLKELGVKDSKHLTDAQIVSIAKDLITFLPYSLMNVMPEKYNQLQPTMSQGKMKALLHNRALLNVKAKIAPLVPKATLIDQFAEKDLYYRYLSDEKEVMNENVFFRTKGESHHLSVAAASIIARYSFLKGLEELSDLVGITLPSGANAKSDVAAARILNKGGMEQLKKVAKLHFANTEKGKTIAGYK